MLAWTIYFVATARKPEALAVEKIHITRDTAGSWLPKFLLYDKYFETSLPSQVIGNINLENFWIILQAVYLGKIEK